MTAVALGLKILSRTHIQGLMKNRNLIGYVDRHQVRSTDQILFFFKLKLPYLLVYKSNSCISRPPIFKVKNQIFIISG